LRFSRRWLWRMPSFGMWRRVDLVWTDVSEERIASIFRVEKSSSEEPAWSDDCSLHPLAHADSSLEDFYTLKMEVMRSSETSVHTRSTRRHIPEDGIFFGLLSLFRKNKRMFMRLPYSVRAFIYVSQSVCPSLRPSVYFSLSICVCPSVCVTPLFVFYAVRVISKESRRLILPRTSFIQIC
jgi:hypothetical protein